MKLDNVTVNVLKEYSSINPSILISPGNELKTISPLKTVIAKTTVKDVFPQEVCIQNLSKFLGILSLMTDPDCDWNADYVLVTDKDGKSKTTMYYAAQSTIVVPPSKDINLPSVDGMFELDATTILKINKAASVLQVPEIVITGADGEINVSAEQVSNKSGDVFSINVGSTNSEFRVVFKNENFVVPSLDYTVQVSNKGLAKFTSKDGDKTYWVATEVRKG